VIKFLITASIVYVALVAFMYLKQRSFIYFPDKTAPVNQYGAEIVEIETNDGLKLRSWYFKARDPTKPTLLYFHGNAGHYGYRIYKASPYIDNGYGVLLAEYRGYGGNAGDPSEDAFYKDGRLYLQWLLDKGLSEDNIILYGESIGSGTATQLASEVDAKALILETPFSSLVDVASSIYFFMPVSLLLKDRYMNIDKIDQINMPLLILHGHEDGTIPFKFAQKLYDKAQQPKEFIEFKSGNHNNLYEYGAALKILEFMNSLEELNP